MVNKMFRNSLFVAIAAIMGSCSQNIKEVKEINPETGEQTVVEYRIIKGDTIKVGYIDSVCANVESLPMYEYPEGTPVAKWGKLKVAPNEKGFRCLCSESGEPIQLRGMSTHGLQWAGIANVTSDNITALAKEWKCSIFRYALYVDEEGGYAYNPAFRSKYLEEVVKWTAENGIYLLIDWHVHNPGNPQASQYRCHPSNNMDLAGGFFTYCSRRFKNQKHVLYELCNEPNKNDPSDPNGPVLGWNRTIRPYCEEMLGIIRENDKDAICICGTPCWDQWLHEVIGNEVTDKNGKPFENVMYTFHFYAASHNDGRPNKIPLAYKENFIKRFKSGMPEENIPPLLEHLPIFVTEWGTTDASGWSHFRPDISDLWLDVLGGNNSAGQKVSWCNWSFSAEGGVCGALKWNTGKISPMDPEILTESGKYVFDKLTNAKD